MTARSRRVQIQPNRYTPTSPVQPLPQSYLLRSPDDVLFIVQKSSIKAINNNYAIIMLQGKRRNCTIEAQGNFESGLILMFLVSFVTRHNGCLRTTAR
jgi:hypothetical protein